MTPEVGDRPRRRWLRYGGWGVGVLSVFGIFGAVGTNVVNEVFPDISEKITGTGSLRINVREDPAWGSDGFTLATASTAGLDRRLGHAHDCVSLFVAGREADAVDVGRSIRNVLLEGSTHRDVTIVDIRPEIISRNPSLRGAEIGCASAGSRSAIGIYFDFDESQPVARGMKDGRPEGGAPYFENGNVIVLKQSEVQPFQLAATSTDEHVVWNLMADVIVDGANETVKIDDDGKPFEISGSEPVSYDRYYEWLWAEIPQRLYIGDRPSWE